MKMTKIFFAMLCVAALVPVALADDAAPKSVSPTDVKNHIGENAIVCGKVVDTKISKYGLAGHGKPVSFDIDQPEPTPIFYFVAFGTHDGGPQEAIDAYKGKQVCVTGKIAVPPSGPPFILAADRTQIKVDAGKAAPEKPADK
ncbi:MAG: hypothetical protein WCA92_16090 [Terriglobales bacterium]